MTKSVEADSVLTLFEASKRLKVSERTLWQLVKNNAVPHFRVGKQIRFRIAVLDEWERRDSTGDTHAGVAALRREASRLGLILLTEGEMEGRTDGQ